MFVTTSEKVTKKELLDLSWRIGDAFWVEPFSVWEKGDLYKDCTAQHALDFPDTERRDTYALLQKEGETVIEVNLRGRYYGPKYERGNLPQLIAIAAWLEANILGAKIWYGGDCDNELILWDKDARDVAFAHFVKVGHAPYIQGFDRDEMSWARPVCAFCQKPMTQFGFGHNYAAYTCLGCDAETKTDDGGKTWTTLKTPGGRKTEAGKKHCLD